MEIIPDVDFNSISFERRLTSLKDSQDSINSCCHWCLANRPHHKKIVNCWLNVLKRAKIEHRLTLFYLANDVIQYSKRRNYDFVESWGTALQKATTMVRDEKVKHKILRIFKIWEQRGIYGDEFLADLCGLISASPSARKGDETHEFQCSYLIQKIRICSKLEADTDAKLKHLKEHNPKIQIESDSLISSLKDRAHNDDVEKEVDDYAKHMEDYISALQVEIKARMNLISLLMQAETQIQNDKKDVKLVATAYKTFGTRVNNLQAKLLEKIPTLSSPIPSPDINAPSPSPDSDIELSINEVMPTPLTTSPVTSNLLLNNTAALYTNAGYYNPVPPPTSNTTTSSFDSSSFSSFIGSNMSFNLQNLNTSSLFGNIQSQNTSTNNATTQAQTTSSYSINDAISSLFPSLSCPPPPPAPNLVNDVPPPVSSYQYNSSGHVPLMPPPMPPFSKSDDNYGVPPPFEETYNGSNNSNYGVNTSYEPTTTPYQPTSAPTIPYHPTTASSYQSTQAPYEPPPSQTYPQPSTTLPPPPTTTFEPLFSTAYPPPSISASPYQNPEPPSQPNYQPSTVSYPPVDEYNPEEELDTWEHEPSWEPPPGIDTPESPPLFEKEGYVDPIEYHDANNVFGNAEDVDHRMLPSIITQPINPVEEKIGHRAKDVDHRNLISLTGSPNESQPRWKMPQGDQDYRRLTSLEKTNTDQDYRVPFNLDAFKLPPPPPPPKMLSSQHVGADSLNTKLEESCPNLDATNQIPLVGKQSLLQKKPGVSPRKMQDNNESIDMDLSDDEHEVSQDQVDESRHSSLSNSSTNNSMMLELPPPFPDLLDDADANKFLDNVNEQLDLGSFDTSDLDVNPEHQMMASKPGLLGYGPPPQMPVNYSNAPFNESQGPPPNWVEQDFHMREFSIRGRGNNARVNFNNRGGPRLRGNFWNIRGRPPIRGGGILFRGIRGVGNDARGNWRGRGRSWGDVARGRGDFRGRRNFRGNFMGGFQAPPPEGF